LNSIDQFVKNWGSKSIMAPISTNDISALESSLTLFLPDSYKYLLSTYGLVHSPNVLTKICDLNSDISAVQDFLSLEDVLSLTKLYEMTGMPKGYVLFASDCEGNMFCFSIIDCKNKQTDVPVWFYNQEDYSVKKESDSFSEWLNEFNSL
jgi:hypothetical protein